MLLCLNVCLIDYNNFYLRFISYIQYIYCLYSHLYYQGKIFSDSVDCFACALPENFIYSHTARNPLSCVQQFFARFISFFHWIGGSSRATSWSIGCGYRCVFSLSMWLLIEKRSRLMLWSRIGSGFAIFIDLYH